MRGPWMGHTSSAARSSRLRFCVWRSLTPTGVKYMSDQIEKGAHGREQRDEQDTLDDDFVICLRSGTTSEEAREFQAQLSAWGRLG